MYNILLVGNGFDLAHGLSTSYSAFWYALKNWDYIYNLYLELKGGLKFEEGGHFDYLLRRYDKLNEDNINILNAIIKNNSWVNYYVNCGAEIDGWIDFEKEIYPVIELFECIFKSNYMMIPGSNNYYGKAIIKNDQLTQKVLRILPLWSKYFKVNDKDSIIVSEAYGSIRYGILKKKMLSHLRTEFEEFIYAFELYLHEFIYDENRIKPLKQIKDMDIKYIISFNYTLTEKLYSIEQTCVHHIHGKLRDNFEEEANNIVMGVSQPKNNSMDFIYFVKYFQRIQKRSGVKYKKFINFVSQLDSFGHPVQEKYILHIYGHSLDETDEDVLKFVIGEISVSGGLNLKPEKVYIYYYDDMDYEQKVINLINLYSRDIVEEYMEKELFEFVETSSEIYIEMNE